MTVKEIVEKCKELKKAMSDAMDRTAKDSDEWDNIYKCSFILSFRDGKTGKEFNINLFTCPETWALFEDLCKEIPEMLEDYEETEINANGKNRN